MAVARVAASAVAWAGAWAAFGLGLASCGGGGHGKQAAAAPSGGTTGPGLTLTLYDGFALVEDRRQVTLPNGSGPVRFDGVAALIDASSVSVFTSGKAKFAEQEFVPAQLPTAQILAESIGKTVRVITAGGTTVGTLRGATAEALLVDTDTDLRLVPVVQVRALEIDGVVATDGTPALVWRVEADGSSQLVSTTYRALGMTWAASYSFVFDEGSDPRAAPEAAFTDVAAWITVQNGAGTTFPPARLRLATPTPDVNMAAVGRSVLATGAAARNAAGPGGGGRPGQGVIGAMDPVDPSIQPDGTTARPARAAETHSYWATALGPLRAGSATQIAYLAPARAVPSRRVLVYDPIGADGVWRGTTVKTDRAFGLGPAGETGVDVYVELDNTVAVGLGQPLPAGKARILQRDADGRVRWLGEDMLQHIGVGERIRLRLGGSADVVGSRKQTEFYLDEGHQRMIEEIEVQLVNKAKTARDVTVLERLTRGDSWTISWFSIPVEKDDARTIRFPVTLAPGETKKFRYRVIYTW